MNVASIAHLAGAAQVLSWPGLWAEAMVLRAQLDADVRGGFRIQAAISGGTAIAGMVVGIGRVVIGRVMSSQASRVLLRTSRSLEKFFKKHGGDFGLTGKWNPGRNAEASRVIHEHINQPGVVMIRGTYRGNPVTHFLDPNSGLNVIADAAGNFVGGWRLSAGQLTSVLTTGRLF